MKHSITDRVLALAGVFQCASLVDQIANQGMANNAIIESSLESLFKFDAATVEDIYGGVGGVMHGIGVLREQFTATRRQRSTPVTRYCISLLVLERKLSSDTAMLDTLTGELEKIESQLEFFSLGHENMYTKLAELYKTTISTLGPKIMVEGEQPYLSNEHNANKVRALLLAGIRSAVLWRQCGGSRWQILFGRKAYIEECGRLLA